MKLTEEQMHSVRCTLVDETSDFVLDRVCELMYEISDAAPHELEIEQIDEIVNSVLSPIYKRYLSKRLLNK
tara:strand:+ start:260 stop:472 length:213 start_codon:yes stop_codon:yes gene_type:complete